MLSPSSCHSCVWLQASPHVFTNVAAGTKELALSLSRHVHLSLWSIVKHVNEVEGVINLPRLGSLHTALLAIALAL